MDADPGGGSLAGADPSGAPSAPEVRTLAIEGIKQMITAGELRAGHRLPSERELARRLNVSRPSLREALLALELMGYVEIEQRRGIFVRASGPDGHQTTPDWDATPALAWDFLEVREEMETRNAALAAQRATEEELCALLAHIEDHERRIDHDPGSTLEAEVEFHLAIAKATHNQAQILLFRTVHEAVHGLMAAVRGSRPPSPKMTQALAREHRAILDAIRAGDDELAASLMKDHMRYAEEALEAHYGIGEDGRRRHAVEESGPGA